MKLYVKFEEVGSEYYVRAVTSISLTPFKKDCYSLDITNPNKRYCTLEAEGSDSKKLNLHPYNCNVVTWGFYNPKKNIFLEDDGDIPDEDMDDYDEYSKIDTYKEGVVIKTKYTQNV